MKTPKTNEGVLSIRDGLENRGSWKENGEISFVMTLIKCNVSIWCAPTGVSYNQVQKSRVLIIIFRGLPKFDLYFGG